MTEFDSLFCHPVFVSLLPSQPMAEGTLFAIAAAPEIPMPEMWMPWLVSSSPQGTGIISEQQTDQLATGLMDGLRNHLANMRDGHILLQTDYAWSENPAERQAYEAFLTGLLHGHQRLEATWSKVWRLAEEKEQSLEESMATRLSRCLKYFSTMANTQLTLSTMSNEKRPEFERNLPVLAQQRNKMLKEYVDLADQLASFLPNQFETFKQ